MTRYLSVLLVSIGLLAVARLAGVAAPACAAEPPGRAAAKPVVEQKKVVFLISAAGSMINDYRDIGKPVAAYINAVDDKAQFNVMTYAGGKAARFSKDAYLPATAANKEKAVRFVGEQKPEGKSLPEPGLEAAFRGRPEAVYFFTNGNLASEKADWLAMFRKFNTNKAKVFIIGRNIHEPLYREQFQKIAEMTGGTFIQLRDEDVQ